MRCEEFTLPPLPATREAAPRGGIYKDSSSCVLGVDPEAIHGLWDHFSHLSIMEKRNIEATRESIPGEMIEPAEKARAFPVRL